MRFTERKVSGRRSRWHPYGIAVRTALPYTASMLTIAETTEFTALWPDYWTAEELGVLRLVGAETGSGDVVPQSGGCRNLLQPPR